MTRWVALFLASFAGSALAQSGILYGSDGANRYGGEEDEKFGQELAVDPPAFPVQKNLIEFYVSPVATNQYFIDSTTLYVGTDRIVRYVLVVRTSGGATNVSFEGIDCKGFRWKHYATGRSDNTWTKSRAARIEWRTIENKPVNRHHAALSRDLFCPGGVAIDTPDEGRDALRRGKHPKAD